ncbi:hypothetical protein YPPY92_2778, partial [Yersinia pestis PY-92]
MNDNLLRAAFHPQPTARQQACHVVH